MTGRQQREPRQGEPEPDGQLSRLDAFAQMLSSVHADVCSGRVGFTAAMLRIRALMPSGVNLLDDLGPLDDRTAAPLAALRGRIPANDTSADDASADDTAPPDVETDVERSWDPTVVTAVVLQSLLVGADSKTVERWSQAYDRLLGRLSDVEAVRAVDGIVRNMADPLLTVVRMRDLVTEHSTQVSVGTLSYLRMRLAALTGPDAGSSFSR